MLGLMQRWMVGLAGILAFSLAAAAQDGHTEGADAAASGQVEQAEAPADPALDAKYPPPTTPLPYVDVLGTGQANVILIPGPEFDERFWLPFMHRNLDKYTMHAVVLPGVSGTIAPPDYHPSQLGQTPYLDNATKAITRYIVNQGLENVYLVGDGIGGKLVFHIAVTHPELIDGGISINGQPVTVVGCLSLDQTVEHRVNCVQEKIMISYHQRDEDLWARRNAMAVRSNIDDPARAEVLGEAAEMQDKQVYGNYLAESLVLDDKLELATCDVPLVFIVNTAVDTLPPGKTLQWWRDRNFATIRGAKNVQYVLFEGMRKYVSESAPEAFDAAVAALVAGEPAPGVERIGPDPDAHLTELDLQRERDRALHPQETPQR